MLPRKGGNFFAESFLRVRRRQARQGESLAIPDPFPASNFFPLPPPPPPPRRKEGEKATADTKFSPRRTRNRNSKQQQHSAQKCCTGRVWLELAAAATPKKMFLAFFLAVLRLRSLLGPPPSRVPFPHGRSWEGGLGPAWRRCCSFLFHTVVHPWQATRSRVRRSDRSAYGRGGRSPRGEEPPPPAAASTATWSQTLRGEWNLFQPRWSTSVNRYTNSDFDYFILAPP